MSSAGITEEGDATLWIHHAESKGWIHTSLPPFVLTFYHQSWYAVDVAVASPLHIGSAIATEVGAWSVAMKGYDAEGAVRIPIISYLL